MVARMTRIREREREQAARPAPPQQCTICDIVLVGARRPERVRNLRCEVCKLIYGEPRWTNLTDHSNE
jgi:hypothetical protein